MLHEYLLASSLHQKGDNYLQNIDPAQKNTWKFDYSLETPSVCRITDNNIDQSIQAKTKKVRTNSGSLLSLLFPTLSRTQTTFHLPFRTF